MSGTQRGRRHDSQTRGAGFPVHDRSNRPVSLDDAVAATVDELMVAKMAAALEAAVEQLGARRLEPLTYTVKDAAAVLNASEDMVRRWVKRGLLGQLPGTERILIPVSAVRAFVDEAAERSQARRAS